MAQGQASLEYLSDDEVYNILKRLRVKNLCQMTTLSSTWKDLINDANLINLHRAWSKMNPLLLIVTQPSVQNHITSNDSKEADPLLLTSVDPADGVVTYQVRIKICKGDVEVLSSGPGCLFCILSQGDFIIFNSSTKVIYTLPKADDPPLGTAAEFGSIRLRHVRPKPILPFVIAVGFGYIESRHVYAVIKLFLSRSCQILMVSDETGEIHTPWRTIDQKYSHLVCPGNNGIMVRNKCYWMDRNIMLAKWMQISPSKMSILCLDMESEMFYVIRYPNFATYEELVDDMQLGDLKDELFLGYTHGDPLVMDIWVLKDLQNSDWNIQYRVDLSLLSGADDRGLCEVKYIGYGEGEQDGVLMFHDSRQHVLLYYNVEERTFKKGKRIQVENHVSDIFTYSERCSSISRPAR